MKYCSDGDVTRHLPTSLPTAFDTAAERLPYITRASGEVQELLLAVIPMGSYEGATQMFPDVDDDGDADTPETIRGIVGRLAAIAIRGDMRTVARDVGPKPSEELQEWVDARVAGILEGRIVITDSAGTSYVRSAIATNVEGSVPVFTQGRYDADGEVIGDVGSLDEYVA